jgi:hypothetical protein
MSPIRSIEGLSPKPPILAVYRDLGRLCGICPQFTHSHTEESLLRPTEIMIGRGNASKAEQKLGWKAKH